MGKIVIIANQKGGVGKTTTAVNLAASLAVADQKTLLIDLDPQGNASTALGHAIPTGLSTKTVYDVLVGQSDFSNIIRDTEMDFLSIAPSNTDLIGAEIELVSIFARESKLKSAVALIKDEYDFIIIDCPPSLGLLTVNALTAADSYLVPLQCEYFALVGLSKLVQTVNLIKQSLNPRLEQEGIVLTMYDKRNRLCNEVAKEARKHFGEKVFQTVIPRNIRLSECSSFGKPIILYDIESKGNTAYLNLAKEFLGRNRRQKTQVSEMASMVSKNENEYFLKILLCSTWNTLKLNNQTCLSVAWVKTIAMFFSDL